MAPEVFLPGHVHNSIADYYSLGVTLFQLLSGQRPYPGSRRILQMVVRMVSFVPPLSVTKPSRIRRTLFSAQQRRAPVPELQYMSRLARLSSSCRSFIGGLLVANPRYRLGCHGTAEVLAHPWLAGVDVEGIRAGSAPSSLPTPPPAAATAADDAKMRAAWSLLANSSEQPAIPVHLAHFGYNVDDPDSVALHPELLVKVHPDMCLQQMARHMHSGSAQVTTPANASGQDLTKASSPEHSAGSVTSEPTDKVRGRETQGSSHDTSGSSGRRAVDVPALAKELRAFREESLAQLRGRKIRAGPPSVMQGFLTSANAAAKVVPESLLLGPQKVVQVAPLRQLGEAQVSYGALKG